MKTNIRDPLFGHWILISMKTDTSQQQNNKKITSESIQEFIDKFSYYSCDYYH